MANIADTNKGNLLKHTLGIAAMAAVATPYLAVCVAAPTDAAPGTSPPAGAGYARMPCAWAWSATAPGQATNSGAVTFPQATATWGLVSHVEVWDALTGGNRLYWEPLVDPIDMVTPKPIQISAGDTLRFPIGNVLVQILT